MDDNAVGLHKRCGPTAFFVIFAKKSGARLSNCYIAQIVGGGGIINLAEKPQNTKREVKIMRRKKLLRQVAAAAVALSMAVSLSAPAFAAEFNLANGGLVITANDSGITVKQDGQKETTIGKDDEIVITGTYSSPNGAPLTAEENQQDENQPVTPAKAPAKEETSEETPGAENAPAAEEKQEQKDTENLTDPEQNTETENKDKNNTNDPADEEEQKQDAKTEDEGQPQPKTEDEDKPKTEANASAEATASASDDASNGTRKAPARSSGEGERTGIIQIFANTLVKLKLKDVTIDQPRAAGTNARGMAAIDIQGSGDVEITVEGQNTLKGHANGAGIQKSDDVSTGKLTITAKDKNQTLNVIADRYGAAIGGNGDGWYGNNMNGQGHGTKNIEINGGTVNTQGRIGSGYGGGSAENIVITGNAVVNANGGIGGGNGDGDKKGKTSITISGNAQVNATDKVDPEISYLGSGTDLAVIGGGYGDTAEITISDSAVVKAKAENRESDNGRGFGTGAVIGGGVGSSSKKSSAKVTIEGNAQVTAENRAYGGSAGIGGGANGTGEVIIGGKAQVKATGSAEHHGSYNSYGAGAAIGDGGTTAGSSGSVQNGENKFTTDKGIQDGAKVEMTNIGHNGPNTVTQTRQDNKWVTNGEQPPEKCSHSNTYAAEKVSPTCTEKGSQTYRCSSCGEIIRVEEVAPNSGYWYHDRQTVTVQPTCTEDGYKVTKCGRCGKELSSRTKTANALGHQFVETTVDPTCTESGYTVSKCTRCGEETGERTNIVAPLGHEYKNGVCTRCGAPEPQENGSAAPNYTVTGAETYETSVVDGRYIIAVPSEDAALNAVLGDLRAIKAQGADVVVFRTRSRESSLVIDEMLAMGTDVTPFVLSHNGGEAQLTINGAVHNELIH